VKLQDGRLARLSAPRIFGAPGTGEQRCGACELVLDAVHLVMLIPSPEDKTFIKVHADCFMLWNEERDGDGRA
jgi:hypothetical protein